MEFEFPPIAVFLIVTAVLTLTMGVISWRSRASMGNIAFALMMLAGSIWIGGRAFEWAATDFATKVFWSKVEYLGIPWVGLFWMIFILNYCRQTWWLTRHNIVILCIIPAITTILAFSNEYHHLIWTSIVPAPGSNGDLLIYTHGVWFWIAATFQYCTIIAGAMWLIWAINRYPHLYRRQSSAMLVGVLFPVIGNIVYLSGYSPIPGLDLTPIGFVGSGVIFAWTVFRLHLFHVVPLAREALVESMPDGMLVLDQEDFILDLNPAARAMIHPFNPDSVLLGKNIREVTSIFDSYTGVREIQEEITIQDDECLNLDMRITPLYDNDKRMQGRLIVLRDITARKKIEEAEHKQRVLAEALQDISSVLNSTLKFDEVLDRILENAERVVPHQAANISLVDDFGFLHIVRERGYPEAYRKDMLSVRLSIFDTPNFKKMLETGQAIVTPDTHQAPHWVKQPGQEWLRSSVSAPIQNRGRLVGFLSLDSNIPGFFSEMHRDNLKIFADQAALAIENSRLYTETQKYVRQVEAMQQVGIAVSSSLNFDKILNIILEQIEHVISFDSASVLLIRNGDIYVFACRGFNPEDKINGLHWPLKTSPQQIVLEQKRPVHFPDIQSDFPEGYNIFPHNLIRSNLIIPLSMKDRIVGFLNLDSHELNHFSAEDERIADAFAVQVAIALENSRLFSEANRRITEQSALNEIIQSISSKLEVVDLLEVVGQQINRLIEINFLLIAQYNAETDLWQAVYLKDNDSQFINMTYRSSEGLTGYIIQSGKPLLLNSVSEIDAVLKQSGRQFLARKPQALMGVPLVLKDRVIGAMLTMSYEGENIYSHQDYSLFTVIASQVAVALENARLFSEVKTLATLDTLTGLYNRRYFFVLAENEIERSRRYNRQLAAIMIDIDHFKTVNDTYGHLVGDQVLRAVAGACNQTLRKIDIAGRYGGEEFIILLPETKLDEAQIVAERLRSLIAEIGTMTPAGEVKVTASLGVAIMDGKKADIEQLLETADQALYSAKQNGRNQVRTSQVQPLQE